MEHILIQCSFSLQIWWQILRLLGFARIVPGSATIQEWWSQLRGQLPGAQCKGFDSLFVLIAWQLWKERNALVFRTMESQPAEGSNGKVRTGSRPAPRIWVVLLASDRLLHSGRYPLVVFCCVIVEYLGVA